MNEQAYEDREGDVWVRVSPGYYALAGSERHAQELLDSGRIGVTLATVHRLYGPLRPVIVY